MFLSDKNVSEQLNITRSWWGGVKKDSWGTAELLSLQLKILCRPFLMKWCLLESYLNPGFSRTSDVAGCHQVKLSGFLVSLKQGKETRHGFTCCWRTSAKASVVLEWLDIWWKSMTLLFIRNSQHSVLHSRELFNAFLKLVLLCQTSITLTAKSFWKVGGRCVERPFLWRVW